MKRINYLIVAMLMAFTMVGCQVDLSDYLTKEEADAKYATIAYVDEKVADLETKINDIDAKFADYYTKGEVDEKLEGYATKKDLEALSDISKAVKEYLATVNWNDYIEDGYTNDEIDEKINAIKEITDKLGNVETLLADVTNLKTSVTSLESTVEELKTTGLSTEQLESIKTTIKSDISGDITTVKNEILANAVTTDGLKEYIKDVFGFTDYDIEVMIDWNKYNSMDYFTFRIAELGDRISTVENLLTVDGVLGKKLTDLAMIVTSNTSGLTSLKETYERFTGTYENLESALETIDLSAYLTSDDLSGYAKTEDIPTIPTDYYTKSEVDTKVKVVADSLAELTSRVETLEGLLDIESDFMKSISTMKLILGNTESGLVKDFNDLKNAVKENTDKLSYKIGDEDYSIEKLAEKVKALYEVKDAYKSYCDSAVSGLAKLSEVNEKLSEVEEKLEGYAKTDMTNVNKQTVVNLVKEYVEGKVAEVTVDTSDFLTSDSLSNYATKTELANYLTSESQIIKNLTSGLATWNVKKGKFIDTTTHNACAYYLINDFICIGYFYISSVPLDATFDELISLANMWGEKVDVDTKNNINRNVVFE